MTQLRLRILHITDAAGEPVRPHGITGSRVRRSIHRLLSENVLCSIASVSAEGNAHINTAYFCYSPELEIYFLSHPNALHCQNLITNPSMAIAIFSSNQTWGDADSGLQLFGTCKQASGSDVGRADTLYGERFAEYRAWKTSLASDSPEVDYRFYRFAAAELKAFDEKELGAGVFVLANVQRHRRSC